MEGMNKFDYVSFYGYFLQNRQKFDLNGFVLFYEEGGCSERELFFHVSLEYENSTGNFMPNHVEIFNNLFSWLLFLKIFSKTQILKANENFFDNYI